MRAGCCLQSWGLAWPLWQAAHRARLDCTVISAPTTPTTCDAHTRLNLYPIKTQKLPSHRTTLDPDSGHGPLWLRDRRLWSKGMTHRVTHLSMAASCAAGLLSAILGSCPGPCGRLPTMPPDATSRPVPGPLQQHKHGGPTIEAAASYQGRGRATTSTGGGCKCWVSRFKEQGPAAGCPPCHMMARPGRWPGPWRKQACMHGGNTCGVTSSNGRSKGSMPRHPDSSTSMHAWGKLVWGCQLE